MINWNKNITIVVVILAIAICGMFVFLYSKQLGKIASPMFNFTNNIYDKIFKKEKFSITPEDNNIQTSTVFTSTVETPMNATTTIAASTVTETHEQTSTVENSTPVIATSTGNTTFISAINQSKSLWWNAKYSESLIMGQTALQKAENDAEKTKAHYWIGLSYYAQGKNTEAEQEELLAIGLNSDYEPSYVTLSAIKLYQGDCNQALAYAQKALRLNQKDYWALNDLGVSYLCLGDKENAVLQLQNAVYLAPGSDVIRNNLNRALQ
jgi:tetratricopeptide (TPR) repeat protein